MKKIPGCLMGRISSCFIHRNQNETHQLCCDLFGHYLPLLRILWPKHWRYRCLGCLGTFQRLVHTQLPEQYHLVVAPCIRKQSPAWIFENTRKRKVTPLHETWYVNKYIYLEAVYPLRPLSLLPWDRCVRQFYLQSGLKWNFNSGYM